MCFIDYGSGDGSFLSQIAGLCPGNRNVFIGIENDPHMASLARSNSHHDSRIVIFEQSFLQSECSDGERRRFDAYLASNTRSNTYFVHYLNNYNLRMAFFRGDGMSLEAKLVVQLEEDAGRRLLTRPSALQNYSLPEVIVSLFPLPNVFDWSMERMGPFLFDKNDMVYSWAPNVRSATFTKYVLADPREYVPGHKVPRQS